MANATDTRDRIMAGFAELQARLSAPEGADAKRKAERDVEAREREQARVRAEYLNLGIEPPSPLALSITARRELGYPVPEPVQLHDTWMDAPVVDQQHSEAAE